MNVGALLRGARRGAGLTQTRLAERAGTSQATLSAYESGAKTPSADTLQRLLAAAGVRLVTVPATRPVHTPGTAALRQAGRGLVAVTELAEQLPTRNSPTLSFPRLPAAAGPA